MGWLEKLWLSWIILSAAAICASCQELTGTLREGNCTCPGEEVVFTCTVTSTLPVVTLAWSSTEYIGQRGLLQFSTTEIPGAMNKTSSIDGNVTATLTNNTNVNGVHILETRLRIVANVASEVTCSGNNGGTDSIEFSISAVPGAPRNLRATEVSETTDNSCILLVQWDPPTSAEQSDIDHYIVYVPSRNVMDVQSFATSVLHVPNCRDDIRIQVAAVNRFGCEGSKFEVQPRLLPTAAPGTTVPTTVSTTVSTTEMETTAITGGQLSDGAIVGIVVTAVGIVIMILILIIIIIFVTCKYKVKTKMEPLNYSQTMDEADVGQPKQNEQETQFQPQLSFGQEERETLNQQHTKEIEQIVLKQKEQATQLEVTPLELASQMSLVRKDLEELKQQHTKAIQRVTQPETEMGKSQQDVTSQMSSIREDIEALKKQHTEAIKQVERKQDEMCKHYEQVNQQLLLKLEELKQQQTKESESRWSSEINHHLQELYNALISKSRSDIRSCARYMLWKLTEDPPQIRDDIIQGALVKFLKKVNDDPEMMDALATLNDLVKVQSIHSSMEKMVTILIDEEGVETGFDNVMEAIEREKPTNIKEILKRLYEQLKEVPESSGDTSKNISHPWFSGRRQSASPQPGIMVQSQVGSSASSANGVRQRT